MTVKKNNNKLIGVSIIVLSVVFVLVAALFVYQTWFAGKDTKVWNTGGDISSMVVSSVPGWNPARDFSPDSPVAPLEIHSFSVDTPDILAGAQVEVTFKAEIFAEEKPGAEDISVKDTRGKLVGYMNDDGSHGDKKADDGIFTLVASIGSGNTASSLYYAEAKTKSEIITSDSTEVFFYTDITADDFTVYNEIIEKLAQCQTSSDVTKTLYQNPNIAKMTVVENGTYVRSKAA